MVFRLAVVLRGLLLSPLAYAYALTMVEFHAGLGPSARSSGDVTPHGGNCGESTTPGQV
jgi:hypothetical protein